MQQECLDRTYHRKMEYYRFVYKNSKRWNGSQAIKNKRVIVYCEQGFGDVIQFVRYVPLLKQKGCYIILHVQKELHNLLKTIKEVDELIDRDDPKIPEHDFHVLSMSLPFCLNKTDVKCPYIFVDSDELEQFKTSYNLGISWEGNPEHSNNDERSCHLRNFTIIEKIPNIKMFMLQNKVNRMDLSNGCADLELYGTEIQDFLDTAKLINCLDAVATVDTSILHLAGAMGKKTYALISYREDPRWEVHNWYPSVQFLKQSVPNDWTEVFKELKVHLSFEISKNAKFSF